MNEPIAFVINESFLAAEHAPLQLEVGPPVRRFTRLSGNIYADPSYYAGINDCIRPATVADFEKYRVSGPEHYGVTE